jgi:hypothetical protein
MAVVMHTYNPSYWGNRDREDPSLRPAWAKSWLDPISTNKPEVIVHAYDPSYWEAQVGGSRSNVSPRQKLETLRKNKQKGPGVWFKW